MKVIASIEHEDVVVIEERQTVGNEAVPEGLFEDQPAAEPKRRRKKKTTTKKTTTRNAGNRSAVIRRRVA